MTVDLSERSAISPFDRLNDGGQSVVILLLQCYSWPCSALRLGNPLRVASCVGSCPTGCGGRCGGRCPCPPPLADRLAGLHQYQGCGFAHVITRSVLAVPAALRVRPLGVPLTLPPANRRTTTVNKRGNETAQTCRALVIATRWPSLVVTTNQPLQNRSGEIGIPPLPENNNITTIIIPMGKCPAAGTSDGEDNSLPSLVNGEWCRAEKFADR